MLRTVVFAGRAVCRRLERRPTLCHTYRSTMSERTHARSTRLSAATDQPDILTSFLAHDFKADTDFIIGWRQLATTFPDNLEQSIAVQRFIDAKIFYYCRKMKLSKDELSRLKQLVSKQAARLTPDAGIIEEAAQEICSKANANDLSTVEGNDLSSAEGNDLATVEGNGLSTVEGNDLSMTEGNDLSTAEGNDLSSAKTIIPVLLQGGSDGGIANSVPSYPTSFRQVMECIEKGVEIPGLETVVVEPTNDPVTECMLQAPKKPWEK